MEKFVHLTADNINQQEPGTLLSRFVGDVDTVRTYLLQALSVCLRMSAKSSVFWW